MSTAVATALAANAAVQSSVAAAEASQAHEVACVSYMANYNAQTATPTQAQYYSECVSTLYPAEEGPSIPGKMLVGTLLLFIFLTIAWGVYRKYKGATNWQLDWCEVWFIRPMVSVIVWAAMWALIAAVMYLFS